MKKDVSITIKSIIDSPEGKDEIELYTKGSYYIKNGCFYISYSESQTTGFDGYRTTLKVEGGDKVTMLRSGDSKSELVIERDKRHLCHYGLPEGDLFLGVSAEKIENKLGESGGDLRFAYSLDVNSAILNTMDVYINVKNISC